MKYRVWPDGTYDDEDDRLSDQDIYGPCGKGNDFVEVEFDDPHEFECYLASNYY